MKHFYMIRDLRAVVDLSQVDESTWEVNRVNVPMQHRGFGHGSKLLREVLADADAEGATLVLSVYPSGPLDYDALVSWYERNGFRFDPGGTDWETQMIRRPRVQECVP